MSDGVTLGEYMCWVRKNGGTCRSGIGKDPAVGMVPNTLMELPSGRFVIHPGGDQSETLSPSLIENYDRRLGVISPFKSTPRA